MGDAGISNCGCENPWGHVIYYRQNADLVQFYRCKKNDFATETLKLKLDIHLIANYRMFAVSFQRKRQ